MMGKPQKFEEWLESVPTEIIGDALWKVEAYRLALFLSDLSWFDVTRLMQDKRTVKVSDQMYRSVGSIGGNLAEGYSRGSGKDRARFYEYSLGSAREARHWYYQSRYVLGEAVVNHRLGIIVQIIRLLLKMVPDQRQFKLKESGITYQVNGDGDDGLEQLLSQPIPFTNE